MRIRLVIRRLLVRPLPGRQHAFVEIDREMFSLVILFLLLISYLHINQKSDDDDDDDDDDD